jgi:resolvase-like protein
MFVGYARVSAQDQNPALQLDALSAAGCERVFVEQASGALRDRPELNSTIEYLRPGDVLVVWKLDRLARSLAQLIGTVEGLNARYRSQISFSHGAEWKALIRRYIGTIPLSGDTPCAAEHIMSASPPDTQVRSAITAKVGAAARPSQPAAPSAAA